MRNKILLALPTILYSPLYIAKFLTLSKEFAHVDFAYPVRNRQEKEMAFSFFHSMHNRELILGVGDPIRTIFSAVEEGVSGAQEPRIIGTLIHKLCYWAGGAFPKEAQSFKNKPHKIIVHPYDMTGYTLAYHYLHRLCGSNMDYNKKIKDTLYCNIWPGEENAYYKGAWMARYTQQVSYLTTDPLKIITDPGYQKYCVTFWDKAEYERVAMSSLITSVSVLKDAAKKMILKDIFEGIRAGIELIHDDTKMAAKILWQYDDADYSGSYKGANFCLRRMDWEITQIESMLNFFVEYDIYKKGLTMDLVEVNRAKEIWSSRSDVNKLEQKLEHVDKAICNNWMKNEWNIQTIY